MGKLDNLTKNKKVKKIKETKIIENEIDLEESEQPKRVLDPTDLLIQQKIIETGILFTVSGGILRQIPTSKVKQELSKNNWDYRLATADDRFMLIDYDKDLARPYIKALLAKVNKLKEVKMLWASLFLALIILLTVFMSFFILLFKIQDIQKQILTKSPTNPVSSIVNPAQTQIQPQDRGSNRPGQIFNTGATEVNNELPIENKLFRPNK